MVPWRSFIIQRSPSAAAVCFCTQHALPAGEPRPPSSSCFHRSNHWICFILIQKSVNVEFLFSQDSHDPYLFDFGLQVAQLQALLQPCVRVLSALLHLLLLFMEELQQLLNLRGQVHILLPRQLDAWRKHSVKEWRRAVWTSLRVCPLAPHWTKGLQMLLSVCNQSKSNSSNSIFLRFLIARFLSHFQAGTGQIHTIKNVACKKCV